MSKTAAVWLSIVILAIMLSPRMRFEEGAGQNVDIRLQDLLIVPLAIFLLANRRRDTALFKLWGWLLPVFVLGATVCTILMIGVDPDVSLFRRVAFLGRGIELFLLAAVVAGLYLRAEGRGMKATLWSIHAAAFVNFGWVLFQLATGTPRTLLGGDVGDAIQSYGPKLIGEASAFGAGQFFAFIAAVGVAELRSRAAKPGISVVLIGMGAIGATVVQSRVSIASVAVAVILVLVVSNGRQLLNPVGVTFVAIGAAIASLTVLPALAGRLSLDAVLWSLGFRINVVWEPLLGSISANPLLGVGPGGLLPPLPIEGHNIAMRAILDYGVIVGAIFLALFVVVLTKSWHSSRRKSEPVDTRMFANLAFVYTLGVLVAGMFQDALTGVTSSHLTMLAVGLFAAVYARGIQKDHPLHIPDVSHHGVTV